MQFFIGDRKYSNQKNKLKPLCIIFLAAPNISVAATLNENNSWLSMIVISFLILQSLLIAGLQHSRINNKRTRNKLRETQRNLKLRIDERSASLDKTNQLLRDEVARHEATGHLLRLTKDYLQSMINSMPSILIGIDAQGQVTHWNAAAENAFEIFSHDALNRDITQLLPFITINHEIISHAIHTGEPYNRQFSDQQIFAQKRHFDLIVYPLISSNHHGAVIRIDDVTLRINIENMMIQNEKMYSLGELAASIAHEINNPLSVVLQNTQNIIRRTRIDLTENKTAADEANTNLLCINDYLTRRRIPEFLIAIQDAGAQAANIVTNMLEFSHSNNNCYKDIEIKKLIEQSLAIFNNIHSHKLSTINIQANLDENLPTFKGSAPEIQQVLLNLLRNAKQALETKTNEHAMICLRAFQRDQYLIIEVEDNGSGMCESVKRQIFEPFFTTKPSGIGTGLGLSVSYFIITEHHSGSIEAVSAPGKGSTFIIKLPIS